MITGGLSCDRVEFGHFGGGSDDPPDAPLATGLCDDQRLFEKMNIDCTRITSDDINMENMLGTVRIE